MALRVVEFLNSCRFEFTAQQFIEGTGIKRRSAYRWLHAAEEAGLIDHRHLGTARWQGCKWRSIKGQIRASEWR